MAQPRAKLPAVCLSRLAPIGFERVPGRAQSFVVRVPILYDEAGYSPRISQRQPQSDRRAVVLNVEREPVDPDRLREAIDDASICVEGILEGAAIRERAMPKARVIWCNKPISSRQRR